jgi:hypothetical protein
MLASKLSRQIIDEEDALGVVGILPTGMRHRTGGTKTYNVTIAVHEKSLIFQDFLGKSSPD